MKTPYKFFRNGHILKLKKFSSYVGGERWKTVWQVNFYLFIHVPFMLFLLAFFVFVILKRYTACMMLFDSFWYCAFR